MNKMMRLLVCVLVAVLLCAACAAPAKTDTASEPGTVVKTQHSHKADFEYVTPEGTASDINGYYVPLGVDCDVAIREKGGDVKVGDDHENKMPTPAKKYKIGFSIYYTVDEVGAMYLYAMQQAAAEAGGELLINDANYEQDRQDTAIEQWILEGVDGVIMTPCDFTGVKASLDALYEAGIPVITIDAPPQLGDVDSMVVYDCVEQGRQAGEMLEQALLDAGTEMKGTVIYNTLPFEHPNATTREIGFFSVFEKYPDIEIVKLTGISPEEHYTAFEGAIQAYPDMLGAWGLYSSATIGMMNAKIAAGRDDILLTSVDNDKPILAGIDSGEIIGTSAYSAIAGSRWGMIQIINMLNGVEIPGILYQQNSKVTKDNVEKMFEHYYPGVTLKDYLAGSAE